MRGRVEQSPGSLNSKLDNETQGLTNTVNIASNDELASAH